MSDNQYRLADMTAQEVLELSIKYVQKGQTSMGLWWLHQLSQLKIEWGRDVESTP